MPRPATPEGQLTPAARQVLTSAGELFYRHGINTVGVEAIAEAAGVTKKTLYDRFGSKDDLVAAYLRERDQRWRAWLAGYVDEHASTPAAKLLVTFDALSEWMRRENPRGCGFVNAHAELTNAEHRAHSAIREQKKWMLGYLTELAEAAGAPRSRDLAEDLLLLHEGAMITSSMHTVEQAVARAKRMAGALLP